MTTIGDTLYYYDVNRRRFAKPVPPNTIGKLLYAEMFVPLKIVGENPDLWQMEGSRIANKEDPRKSGFFTTEQMADDIWMKENRGKIRDLVDKATADQLREIGKVLGYPPLPAEGLNE